MEGGGRQMTLGGLEALELRRALETERAARAAADRRLAETAHDLRAALASIIGYAHMLADPRQDVLSTEQVAERISRLALGLCEITTDLLGRGAAASITAGVRRRFPVRAVLEGCAHAVEPLCREKNLGLKVELPAEEEFAGDVTLVRRVVHNLLTNAVRYTEHGEVGLRGRLDPSGLAIEVSDTGVGIPEEDHERVFEEFCRLDPGRRMAPLGTGLGLATVKRLCDRSGGRVEVASRVGVGSTFRVWLPRGRTRRGRRMPQADLFAPVERE